MRLRLFATRARYDPLMRNPKLMGLLVLVVVGEYAAIRWGAHSLFEGAASKAIESAGRTEEDPAPRPFAPAKEVIASGPRGSELPSSAPDPVDAAAPTPEASAPSAAAAPAAPAAAREGLSGDWRASGDGWTGQPAANGGWGQASGGSSQKAKQ